LYARLKTGFSVKPPKGRIFLKTAPVDRVVYNSIGILEISMSVIVSVKGGDVMPEAREGE
jgi:hypothetical protein